MEQKSFMRMHGYRVLPTNRRENGLAVEYPRLREAAFCRRYSLEVFTSEGAAWVHAWADAQQDPDFELKWQRYRRLNELAAQCARMPSIPRAYGAMAAA
jgi:hypothetical protein